ncbi:hypothetical protein ACVGW3_05185, partial [Enterobacter hormaechei]
MQKTVSEIFLRIFLRKIAGANTSNLFETSRVPQPGVVQNAHEETPAIQWGSLGWRPRRGGAGGGAAL